MSAAQIYNQYISDYENAAKKYNRKANAYQDTVNYQGGPVHAKSTDGQDLGLYITTDGGRNIVKQGTSEDYQKAYQAANEEQRQNFGNYIDDGKGGATWTQREGQDTNAIHTFGNSGWGGGQGEGYYKDVGNGYAAARTGGKGTGQFVTERISGDDMTAQQMRDSGKYKDVKFVPGESGTDENGNPYSNNYIDVTYEQMAFPDQPGEFKAKKPELSMAQLREMANPTPTMAEAERSGVNDVGLIEAARNQFNSAKPGLISSSR